MLIYWDGLLFIYTNNHMDILRTKNIAFGTEMSKEQKYLLWIVRFIVIFHRI